MTVRAAPESGRASSWNGDPALEQDSDILLKDDDFLSLDSLTVLMRVRETLLASSYEPEYALPD